MPQLDLKKQITTPIPPRRPFSPSLLTKRSSQPCAVIADQVTWPRRCAAELEIDPWH
jgi:hypothetical protein